MADGWRIGGGFNSNFGRTDVPISLLWSPKLRRADEDHAGSIGGRTPQAAAGSPVGGKALGSMFSLYQWLLKLYPRPAEKAREAVFLLLVASVSTGSVPCS